MLQVKVISTVQVTDLESSINEFLTTVDTESVKDISVDVMDSTAVIQYEIVEEWKNALCCDCQHWDDGGSTSNVSGLCHECGQRRRFNCKACKKFKDVRG